MVNDGKIRGVNHREVMVDDDKMMINNARCPPKIAFIWFICG